MKQLLIEALCHNCELIVYSTVFYEDCTHFCPECGDKLEVTKEKYQLNDNAIQAKYYLSREKLQMRALAMRKKGFTLREIGSALGISYVTAHRMISNKVVVTQVENPPVESMQLSFGMESKLPELIGIKKNL